MRAARTLALGALPYVIVTLALRDNAEPDAAGPWLGRMLAGPLYASLARLVVVSGAALPWRESSAAAVARAA